MARILRPIGNLPFSSWLTTGEQKEAHDNLVEILSSARRHRSHQASSSSKEIEDWSHTIVFTPKTTLQPTSVEHLISLLSALPSSPPPSLTVLGSHHSSSRIFQNDQIVVDVTGMPVMLEWSPDFVTVRVSTNVPLRLFLLILATKGRSLPATGGTDEQTLAGVIGTNTAPATKYFTMYSGLKRLKYLGFEDGKYVVKEVTIDEVSPFIPNLGALGILLEATFETVPDQYFYTIQKIGNVDELLKSLTFVDGGHDYPFWRIDWVPQKQDGLVWAARPITPGPHDDPDGDYPTDYVTSILKKVAFYHNQTPFLDKLLEVAYDLAVAAYMFSPTIATGPLRNMLPVDRYTAQDMYCTMAEWSFLPQDAPKVKAIAEGYFKANRWPNLPIEIELVKRDHYPLSPWNHGDDDVTYLVKFNFMYLSPDVVPQGFREQIEAHLKGLWDLFISNGLKFKGHWGKVNFTTPAQVRSDYQWEKFAPLVVPPLINPYLKEKLDP